MIDPLVLLIGAGLIIIGMKITYETHSDRVSREKIQMEGEYEHYLLTRLGPLMLEDGKSRDKFVELARSNAKYLGVIHFITPAFQYIRKVMG